MHTILKTVYSKPLARVCFALGLTALLTGCSTDNTPGTKILTPGSVPAVYQVQDSLDSAAQKAAKALTQLAAIKKAEHPHAPLPFLNLEDPALNQSILLNNYYGPIKKIVELVAKQTGYSVQLFGKPPVLPILIDLNPNGAQPALELLRNIDLQAGQRAAMMILPKYKIISLRYMS